MNSNWKLQDAKARFSELVDRALSEGPQHVTRRGEPAVVVVAEKDFAKAERIRKRPKRNLIELIQSCPAPEIFNMIEAGRREPGFGRRIDSIAE